MKAMVDEVRQELTGHIIPFWLGLRDDRRGGFTGLVDAQLVRHPDADRGCILNSRILWFFSETYRLKGGDELLDAAKHAYAMLKRMTDTERGGVFWSLRADGAPADTAKYTYCQAFAVYALAAYHRACGDGEALQRADALFDVIEERCRDDGGYLEAFGADWSPRGNVMLSGNGVTAERTMNTLLHVLEAYTGLYEAAGEEKVRRKLYEIFDLFEKRIYSPEKHRQEVFFDRGYRPLIDLTSYGHDIETSWLADRALDVLRDPALTARIRPKLTDLADAVLREAFDGHGVANEREGGRTDTDRIWWVQAEALLGFMNAWQRTGQERFRRAALSQWAYIRDHIVDRRPGGEWYWLVHEGFVPGDEPVVDPWKCPYHNGRMAVEVLRRLGGDAEKEGT